MSDLPNLESSINEALIRRYAEGASADGIRNLITLMDFWKRQLNRVEIGNRAAWDEVRKLQALLGDPRHRVEVSTETPRPQPTTGNGRPGAHNPPPKAPPKSQAISIDLGDL